MFLSVNTELKNGEYRILDCLGQGGFGITYLAHQVRLNRKVVIKEFYIKEYCDRDRDTLRVTLGTSGSGEMVARFLDKFVKEARCIAALDHPNIVRIMDIFEENNTCYYVMEYHPNGALGTLVDRQGALGEQDALRYIRQVASALKCVHGDSMMHLDVKPDNILLNNRNESVLIDFGVSKHYDDSGKATSTTPVGISHGYAPMEQYLPGGVGEFSPATDIYSLGATLYTLLTGEVPPPALQLFDSSSLQGDLVGNNVGDAVVEAIVKSMSMQKEARPQSIDEFLALLDVQTTESLSRVTELMKNNRPTQPKNGDVVVEKEKINNRVFSVGDVSFTMVAVAGGTFNMGSNDSEVYSGEKPVHSVTLSDYYIGETVVTQALWEAVLGGNPSVLNVCSNPVEQVSYNDCIDFINKLNTLLAGQLPDGRKFRLPTEAEWEFAARGGNKSKGYKYSGSNSIDAVAWYDDNSGDRTHPVKGKQPNELGIYDMTGNVWEWCSDWYNSYSSSSQTNPKGPSSGYFRVLRGGSRGSDAQDCRVACRDFSNPSRRSLLYGLRLAF